MNRQIKFRAKRLDNGQWVTGDLGTNPNHKRVIFEYLIDNKSSSHLIRVTHEVDPSTVSQYTGRDDDFETPIYEGDIVDNDASVKELVKFYIHDDQQGYTMDLDSPLKVIGNKWDNPDIEYYEFIDKYNPKL